MSECERFRESLGAWLDGELKRSDSEAVRAHVESCLGCQQERRQLEKLQLALASVLKSEGSGIAFEALWSGVQERIGRKRVWHRALLEWSRGVLAGPRLAWAIPAVIVLLLGVFSLNSFWPGFPFGDSRSNFTSVESIDTYGRNVAVLRENKTKTTVIWLYQNQEGDNESSDDTTETRPSF